MRNRSRQNSQARRGSKSFALMVGRNRDRLRDRVLDNQRDLLDALREEVRQAYHDRLDVEILIAQLFATDPRRRARAHEVLRQAFDVCVDWIEETRIRILTLDCIRFPSVPCRVWDGPPVIK